MGLGGGFGRNLLLIIFFLKMDKSPKVFFPQNPFQVGFFTLAKKNKKKLGRKDLEPNQVKLSY